MTDIREQEQDGVSALWPQPRRVVASEGRVHLSRGLRLESEAPRVLRAVLEERGWLAEAGLPVRTSLEPDASTSSQGYRLEVTATELRLRATTAAGLFYGSQTLLQLLESERLERRQSLRCMVLDDWPQLERRGVMLDVSRDRVPRMDQLFEWVRRLAALKINELQLYTEHTFAYPGHETVWQDASPFTPAEIRALDQHCRDHFIELVPNQQSFGHMHRWLKHPSYQHLAEYREGIEHPFSFEAEPYGLCATDPASLQFLAGLYDDLLPNFTSQEFNVGLDEALDLGLGRSKASCAELGRGRVYADFTNSVHELIRERGKRMQFWADEVEDDSELSTRLPEDAIAMLWGYEAGHAFEEKAATVRRAGLELRLCPGTSSWQSLSGRTHNALSNLSEATRAANSFDATGLTICDWGDRGHLQPPSMSELGIAVGAGLAWNEVPHTELSRERVARILDQHVFRDPSGTLGSLFYDLGCVHEPAGGTVQNGTALFFLLIFANSDHPHERTAGLDGDGLRESRTRIEQLLGRIASARSQRADAQLLGEEARWVLNTLDCAALLGQARHERPGGGSGELPAKIRAELAARLRESIAGHGALWIRRSRPGGMLDSRRQLVRALEALGTE